MSRYRARNLTGLSTALKLLLAFGMVLLVVSMYSSWLELNLLDRAELAGGADEDEADANDRRQMVVALITLAFRLATVIVFCIWIYRANANVRAFGARYLRYTPGWAVGWFFVPIVCLWKPAQAMNDLWRASKHPERWESVPASGIVTIWWICWLVSNVIGQASLRASLHAETISALKTAAILDIVAELIEIPLSIAAFVLVSQIQTMQASFADPDDIPYDDDDRFD